MTNRIKIKINSKKKLNNKMETAKFCMKKTWFMIYKEIILFKKNFKNKN
jgi:hypothetical protein